MDFAHPAFGLLGLSALMLVLDSPFRLNRLLGMDESVPDPSSSRKMVIGQPKNKRPTYSRGSLSRLKNPRLSRLSDAERRNLLKRVSERLKHRKRVNSKDDSQVEALERVISDGFKKQVKNGQLEITVPLSWIEMPAKSDNGVYGPPVERISQEDEEMYEGPTKM